MFIQLLLLPPLSPPSPSPSLLPPPSLSPPLSFSLLSLSSSLSPSSLLLSLSPSSLSTPLISTGHSSSCPPSVDSISCCQAPSRSCYTKPKTGVSHTIHHFIFISKVINNIYILFISFIFIVIIFIYSQPAIRPSYSEPNLNHDPSSVLSSLRSLLFDENGVTLVR